MTPPTPPEHGKPAAAQAEKWRTDHARHGRAGTGTSGATSAPEAPPPVQPPIPTSWQAVTLADIDRDLTFDRLP
jgi:hypothetical protein